MMRYRPFLMVCVLLFAALGIFAAQVQERVLPNGLKILVKEVHAAPVVVVDSWYKVGSRNEGPGMTGASHLLEHMTYKGTKEFGKDAMKTLAKRNGAIDNGATYYDYTHYYTTIASDRVELPLRVEASRMSSALIRQEDLDSERVVVRSELEGRENSPGSLLFNAMMSAAYTAHPYKWPVVGWRADVEHVTAAQLRDYYHQYYLPNNATLVVVGDVDAEKVFAQAAKLFGRIKRGPQPPQWVTPEPDQRGERCVVIHRQGQVPFEQIAWHVPDINNADVPALMMLEQVLGSGRLSRLYQKIVEGKIGVSAWAGSMILKDPGIFLVGGVAPPGGKLDAIEAALLSEVERIKTEPPTAEEMARARRQSEAALIFARDSVTDQAEQLGYYETVAGDWKYLDHLPDLLHKVTPEDVSRVAKTYLTADGRTIGVFQPAAPAKTAMAPALPAPAGYRQPGSDDRLPAALPAAPAVASSVASKEPVKRERFVLPNGLVLIVQENHANTTVVAHATIKAGKAYDPAGKASVADMVANLLDRGTTTRSSNAIAAELEGAAAEISAGTGWETVGIRGKALSGDVELLLRNIADLVRNANFPADEVEKMREQMQAGLAFDIDSPDENARRNLYRAVLPEGNPYRMASLDEEQAGLKALTRDDLLAFYKMRYTPKTTIMAVVGDVTVAQVRELVVKYFGDWQGQMPKLLDFTPVAPGKAQRVVATIPDKSEVAIYAGYAGGLRRTDPDYYAAEVMNLLLGGGGALNSRLGDVIRDQNGLAYSVYSDFHASTGAGPWYVMLGVNPTNTDKAIDLLKAEIARFRDQGVKQSDVSDAIAYITGAHAIVLETNAAIAGELMDADYFNLGLDYPERYAGYYRAVTVEQVNATAKKYLHPDMLTISIAGAYKEK